MRSLSPWRVRIPREQWRGIFGDADLGADHVERPWIESLAPRASSAQKNSRDQGLLKKALLRRKLGTDTIPSNRFASHWENGYVVVSGQGHGHGHIRATCL